MANMFSSTNTGITVAMGKIKSISDNRLEMIVESGQYVKNSTGKSVLTPVDVSLRTMVPFEADKYRVGFSVAAVGYGKGINGNVMQAQAVLTSGEYYANGSVAVVTGYVKKTFMNQEKNADGSAKLNQAGAPKKPHFDIVVAEHDETNNRWVDHVIRIYDGRTEPGKRGQIETMQYRFKDFDPEKNTCRVTFVTQPAEVHTRTYIKNDGREGISYSAYHLGCSKLDYEFLGERQQSRQTASQPVPANTPPAQPAINDSAVSAPVTAPQILTQPPQMKATGNGFEEEMDAPTMDDLQLFS